MLRHWQRNWRWMSLFWRIGPRTNLLSILSIHPTSMIWWLGPWWHRQKLVPPPLLPPPPFLALPFYLWPSTPLIWTSMTMKVEFKGAKSMHPETKALAFPRLNILNCFVKLIFMHQSYVKIICVVFSLCKTWNTPGIVRRGRKTSKLFNALCIWAHKLVDSRVSQWTRINLKGWA